MQCHNFNEDWTFEKADQADRLKDFYGNSNAVAVTLPHDAMIREKRDKDCPSGAQSGFYPGGVYTYEKKFMAITVNSLTADGIQAQEFTEMSICGPEKMYIFHMISCVLQHCQ